ncbi:hypothetical protein FQA39_LY16764 [Lamprigera yunnana]|nr:hypothetical protein FQA39_LY16764 [Lamprigera yunnana]
MRTLGASEEFGTRVVREEIQGGDSFGAWAEWILHTNYSNDICHLPNKQFKPVMIKFGFTYEQIKDDGLLQDHSKVNTICKWAKEEEKRVPSLTEEQTVLFLLSCEEDVEYTKNVILAYYRIKRSSPDIFDDRLLDADDVQSALKMTSICVLPLNTYNDCVIVLVKFTNARPWNWSLKNAAKAVFMAIDCAIYEYPPKGLIILIDMENFTWTHLLKLRPILLKTIFDYLQEALPVKLKDIHVLNTVSFITQLLNIISPLMNKELLKKIHFHPRGLDWDDFHKTVLPKSALCKDYGGELASISECKELTLKKLRRLEEHFEAEQLLRYEA